MVARALMVKQRSPSTLRLMTAAGDHPIPPVPDLGHHAQL
jgi:hypothetical protein